MEKRRRILCIAACVLAICSFAIFVACDAKVNIKKDVLIEAGTPITLQAFFDEQVPDNAMFLTDISGIDTNIPAVYQLKIACGNQEEDVVLRIEDHTGPTGNAVPVTIYSNWKMPDAADCVSHLYDLSGRNTCFYCRRRIQRTCSSYRCIWQLHGHPGTFYGHC